MTATVEHSRPPATISWWVEHRYLLAIGGITLLGAIVRIVGLGSEPLWLDEAYTARYTTLTPGKLWSFDPPYDRANPPGYILFMKVWAQLGRSDEWFRASSLIAGVLTIPVVYLICFRMGNRRAGLVAALLFALAGFHVQYSQEARAYAILALLVAVVILAVIQLIAVPDSSAASAINGRSRNVTAQAMRWPVTWTHLAWPAYGVAMGLSLHMHNTSITIPLAANIGVGIWWLRSKPKPPRFARKWVLANLLGFVIWAPWIPGFVRQVGWVENSFWATAPSPQVILRDLATLADAHVNRIIPPFGSWWVDALVMLALITLAWLGVRRMDQKYRPTILAFMLVLPVTELILTLRRPVFLGRTLLWIVVATLVAVGFSVAHLRGLKLLLATGALLVIPVLSTVGYHVGFEKTPWDEAAAIVAAEAGPDDIVFVVHAANTVPFRRYFDEYEKGLRMVGVPRDLPDRQNEGTVLDASDLDIISDLVRGRAGGWLLLNREVRVTNSDDIDPTLREMFANVEMRQLQDLVVIKYTS